MLTLNQKAKDCVMTYSTAYTYFFSIFYNLPTTFSLFEYFQFNFNPRKIFNYSMGLTEMVSACLR